MTLSEHKKILSDLDNLIISFEKIMEKNGKDDPKAKTLDYLIMQLSEAFSEFEGDDGDLDDE